MLLLLYVAIVSTRCFLSAVGYCVVFVVVVVVGYFVVVVVVVVVVFLLLCYCVHSFCPVVFFELLFIFLEMN